MDTNDELDNSIIIKRRQLHNNEFIFKNGCLLQNVEKMFDYIEANSQLKIDKISRHELPLHQGYFGYRIGMEE